jgi:hypothetical protein
MVTALPAIAQIEITKTICDTNPQVINRGGKNTTASATVGLVATGGRSLGRGTGSARATCG